MTCCENTDMIVNKYYLRLTKNRKFTICLFTRGSRAKNIYHNIIKYKTCCLYLPRIKIIYAYEFLRPAIQRMANLHE